MKIFHSFASLTFLFILYFCQQVNAKLITKKTVSLELAKKLSSAAENLANKDKLNVVISIVDDGGNLDFFEGPLGSFSGY